MLIKKIKNSNSNIFNNSNRNIERTREKKTSRKNDGRRDRSGEIRQFDRLWHQIDANVESTNVRSSCDFTQSPFEFDYKNRRPSKSNSINSSRSLVESNHYHNWPFYTWLEFIIIIRYRKKASKVILLRF